MADSETSAASPATVHSFVLARGVYAFRCPSCNRDWARAGPHAVQVAGYADTGVQFAQQALKDGRFWCCGHAFRWEE